MIILSINNFLIVMLFMKVFEFSISSVETQILHRDNIKIKFICVKFTVQKVNFIKDRTKTKCFKYVYKEYSLYLIWILWMAPQLIRYLFIKLEIKSHFWNCIISKDRILKIKFHYEVEKVEKQIIMLIILYTLIWLFCISIVILFKIFIDLIYDLFWFWFLLDTKFIQETEFKKPNIKFKIYFLIFK